MEKQFVQTHIGNIAVFKSAHTSTNTPVIFLHGVYFDHHLWEAHIAAIHDRTVYAIDMPMHGESTADIKTGWTLDDCAAMLIEVLDSLELKQVIAIGHSWGSMTILRAAHTHPERFLATGLCNMPFKAASSQEVRNIRLQHSAMIFRGFYMKQAAKALMAHESLHRNPDLIQKLIRPMSLLSNKTIRYTDEAVRMQATDATPLIEQLRVPTLALVGKEDYVGIPPFKNTVVVEGGHVSPLEIPAAVNTLIQKLLQQTNR